jgi:hypothetical protein
MKKKLKSQELPKIIFTDFDGCLTDDRVWLNQDGEEFVAANRKDGLAINRLKALGINVVITSTETNQVVSARATKLGVEALQGLSGIFLEFNHDRSLLAQGDYPPSLKSRVGGDFGHLSNEQAGALLADCHHAGLEVVVAAHLSQNNNHPSLVRAAVSRIDLGATRFEIALQETGSDWITLSGHG